MPTTTATPLVEPSRARGWGRRREGQGSIDWQGIRGKAANGMNDISIKSFSQLESLLEGWTSFADEHVYDFGGIIALLAACVRNIDRNAIDGDYEDLPYKLSEQEVRTLRRIVDAASQPKDDQV